MIFLIEYERPTRRTLFFKAFEDEQREMAHDERLKRELALNEKGLLLKREVVLLEASSVQQLRQTHERYFHSLPDPTLIEK